MSNLYAASIRTFASRSMISSAEIYPRSEVTVLRRGRLARLSRVEERAARVALVILVGASANTARNAAETNGQKAKAAAELHAGGLIRMISLAVLLASKAVNVRIFGLLESLNISSLPLVVIESLFVSILVLALGGGLRHLGSRLSASGWLVGGRLHATAHHGRLTSHHRLLHAGHRSHARSLHTHTSHHRHHRTAHGERLHRRGASGCRRSRRLLHHHI